MVQLGTIAGMENTGAFLNSVNLLEDELFRWIDKNKHDEFVNVLKKHATSSKKIAMLLLILL